METPSFHNDVIEQLKDNPNWTWSAMNDEEKTSYLGLLLISFLDRLRYAEFDVDPVLNSLDQLIHSIDVKVSELYREQFILAPVIKHLNRYNKRQMELFEDNDKEYYSELMHLSQEMLNRLAMIHDVLRISKTEYAEIGSCYSRLINALIEMADHLDDLALRHFYAAFQDGKFESLAAICMGGGFLRSAAGAIEFRLTDDSYWEFGHRYYDLKALISLGKHFDFRTFDDDTNPLLPEVAELLFEGGSEDAE